MLLPIFRLPSTNRVRFKSFLEVTSNSQPALSFMDNARTKMVSAISSGSAVNAEAALSEYLGHIYSLYTWAKDRISSGKTIDAKPLEFSWQSPLSNTSFKFDSQLIVSELIHTLSALAAAKFDAAVEFSNSMTEENREDMVTKAVRLFKEAAGVFQYINQSIIPTFSAEVPKGSAPEYFSMPNSASATLCLACAEFMLVQRGLWSGTAPSLLGKIAASAAANAKQAHSSFLTAADQKPAKINSSIMEFCLAMQVACEGVSYGCCALEAVLDEKWGQACGYAQKALTLLPVESDLRREPRDERYTKNASILAKMAAQAKTAKTLDYLVTELRTPIYKNSNVYYQVMPALATLVLPSARAVATATPFEDPQKEFVSLALVQDLPRKGLLGRKGEGQGKVEAPKMDMKGGNPFGSADGMAAPKNHDGSQGEDAGNHGGMI